jgi:hypothetical protein
VHDFAKLSPAQRRQLIAKEVKARKSGEWGVWEEVKMPPGAFEATKGGWLPFVEKVYRNKIFCVLYRVVPNTDGVIHLAISSLSQVPPSFYEHMRIKDDLVGMSVTAVEVYPPRNEVVDGADMTHLWVLPRPLPFSLYHG